MRRVMTLVAMLATSPAWALTATELDVWINSMPQIQGWLDQHEDAMPKTSASMEQGMAAMFQEGIKSLKTSGLYSEFGRKVSAAGFDSVEQWTRVTTEVSLGMLAVEMSEQGGSRDQVKQQLAQLQQMRNAGGMPAEQLDAMETMMRGTLKMMDEMEAVDAADKTLVSGRMAELRQLMQ
ncbi:hypothetical protein [Candidatus Thalassolituus haligoni]|jgi:hypothetical protein|uniref:hypothetical protein n=1 Tax=Candidatus Thalassolituus haligoni TaxID=3100113 RepID=UPI0035127F4A|tara:strand:+ start:11146 stop:11682 length:537 start_codon:yes stop_codon:yes gene_type:complete